MTAAISALVVAKAPVPGQVKTRLGATVGAMQAAELAAASLLDTIEVCGATFGVSRCHLALVGDLSAGVAGREIALAVSGWHVHEQRGAGLAERLANAHAVVPGPVVQVGMDTPQITTGLLTAMTDALVSHDAALGPARDGGWWALAVRDTSHAAALANVPMSIATTYDSTRAALLARKLRVATGPMLRDVDDEVDAAVVAAATPKSRFAGAWSGVRVG